MAGSRNGFYFFGTGLLETVAAGFSAHQISAGKTSQDDAIIAWGALGLAIAIQILQAIGCYAIASEQNPEQNFANKFKNALGFLTLLTMLEAVTSAMAGVFAGKADSNLQSFAEPPANYILGGAALLAVISLSVAIKHATTKPSYQPF